MPDFSRFQTPQTLKAAGLPTDLNRIIGRVLSFRKRDGSSFRYTVTGITFGIKTLKLFLDCHVGVFARQGLLCFDSFESTWEGWFEGKEEPEYLASVRLD